MRIVISACTHRAFSDGPLPLAHLRLRQLVAVNENAAQPKVNWASIVPTPREAPSLFIPKGRPTGGLNSLLWCLHSLLASSQCLCFRVSRCLS